jgi:hypothetical protein
MVSTGMRIGALPDLRLVDLTRVSDHRLYKIQVYGRSKKDRYYTFCSPECAVATDAYLDYRRRFGEVLIDNSPLLREQFNVDNPFTIQSPKPLSHRMASYTILEALKRSGCNSTTRRKVMLSHGFRKFYVTQCIKANLQENAREYLVGHQLRREDPSYDRTSEEDRLREYLKVVDLLTINPEHSLKKRVQELESEQAQEINRLKADIYEDREANNRTQVEMKVQKAQVDELLRFCKFIGWPFFANSTKIIAGYRARKKVEAELELEEKK